MIGKDIKKAAQLLKDGLNIAMPTETVYGLAANALDDKAVASIYKIKERPTFNPLIVHSYSIEKLEEYVIFDDIAKKVANKFWPGSLTLILPRKNNLISSLATCNLDTIGVRIPNHKVALDLLRESNLPICAPSANKSCKISPTNAAAVKDELDDLISYILDGDDCAVGLESTIVDLTSHTPKILRHGAITKEMLETVLDSIDVIENSHENIIAPGMMKKHYSPNIELTMNAINHIEGYAFIGFGKLDFQPTLNLSEDGCLIEAASNLFKFMRELDNKELYKGILVSPIPNEGIGIAINDRLTRASYK